MGRYRNLLTYPDGSRRWPLLGYETVKGYENRLPKIAPIELIQMIQNSLEEITVRLVMPRALNDEEKSELTAFIQENLGYPFRLSFEYVDSIRNPINGKVEQFISLIEPGHP
jgi:phenylacetate-CoA ligase